MKMSEKHILLIVSWRVSSFHFFKISSNHSSICVHTLAVVQWLSNIIKQIFPSPTIIRFKSPCKFAHFLWNSPSFATPQQKVKKFGCIPWCCIFLGFRAQCLLPFPTLHNVQGDHISQDDIKCWKNLQASSTLPHLAYISTKILSNKDMWIPSTFNGVCS